ncbi:MAG: MFS transporter, partial [Rhodobacter sp.]|nr:MFS transporter [Rhodobacter sp.]
MQQADLSGALLMTDLHLTRRGRWAVSAMFLANGFIMGAWAPQIPLLLPRHQITEATLGLLILVLGLGAISAMLFSGRLIEIFGARRVLRVFALSILPALPLVVFAPNLMLLIPAMALFGATLGSMDVVMNAHAVEVERRLGRAVMSSLHGFWSVGGFLGGAGGGLLLAQLGAEGQALWAAGMAGLAVLVAMPFLAPDDPRPILAPGVKPERARLLPRAASVWILGLLALFCMVPEGAVLDWAALYVRQELGAEIARSGLAF